MAEDIREDAYSRWEAEWEKQDFSWEGLAKKEITPFVRDGLEIKNLQDYWRWSIGIPQFKHENQFLTDEELKEAKLLTEIDGKLWHALHQKDIDATKHPCLSSTIHSRLILARQSTPKPRPVYFCGARCVKVDRLLREDPNNKVKLIQEVLFVDASWAEMSNLNATNSAFYDDSSFESAWFGSEAKFNGATFGKRVRFDRSIFQSGARFEGSKFREEALFDGAQFGDNAYFDSAQFGPNANFARTKFGDRPSFNSAQFHDRTRFDDAVFGTGTLFNNSSFGDHARFSKARFKRGSAFNSAFFGTNAKFDNVSFGGSTRFVKATIGSKARFDYARFEGDAHFDRLTLKGNASWHAAEFQGYASFYKASWDATGQKVHYGGAFSAARFRDVADFKTHSFWSFAAFDGATFEKTLLITPPPSDKAAKVLFREGCTAVNRAVQADLASAHGDCGTSSQVATSAKIRRWDELSGGYRTAKAAMERQGAFERAQGYYRHEIQARLKKPSTTSAERIAGRFYATFSDYGASIGRPFIGLLASFIVFAALYVLLALGHQLTLALSDQEHWPDIPVNIAALVEPAFDLSFSNALGNFDPTETVQLNAGGERGLRNTTIDFGSGVWFWTARVLSAAQTLVSLILAFLFGLAVRRKFQIK
ncbi:MAG: pentapeptide repeat-containing protein [Pseudomonadota bacterium]